MIENDATSNILIAICQCTQVSYYFYLPFLLLLIETGTHFSSHALGLLDTSEFTRIAIPEFWNKIGYMGALIK